MWRGRFWARPTPGHKPAQRAGKQTMVSSSQPLAFSAILYDLFKLTLKDVLLSSSTMRRWQWFGVFLAVSRRCCCAASLNVRGR
jgi:hypothetical protein